MLLSEALSSRKAALKSIGELTEELKAAYVKYEDSEPQGDAGDIAEKLDEALASFELISLMINRTNNATEIQFKGRTMNLMEAVAMRERLLLTTRAYKAAYEDASEKVNGRSRYGGRRSKDEIRFLAVLPVADLKEVQDEAAQELRELDMEIQKANWRTELLP